jgi:hypothetical protein
MNGPEYQQEKRTPAVSKAAEVTSTVGEITTSNKLLQTEPYRWSLVGKE